MELFRKIAIFFYDTLQSILLAAALFLVLYMFIIQPHEVSGSSMYPTFKNKEYLLSYLLDVRLHHLKRYDIIVFHSPVEQDKLYIKRIIGLAGDSIKLVDGFVYVNGEQLDESAYLANDVRTYGGAFLADNTEVKILPNTYFVLGDNRENSSDSRSWGFLDYDKVIGRSFVRVWPMNQFEVVTNPYPNRQ